MPIRIALFLAACVGAAFAQQQATISGQIFDATNGQPVRGASISTKENASLKTSTDTDGKYQLLVPEGKYTLVVKADNFVDAEIDGIEAKIGTPAEASTVMAAKGTATTVEVTEKVGALAATAEAMLTERKLSASVSDSISSDDIRKTVASDAAGAIEKVTGVSIVDSGYVYVRGLGERYSSTMLNNAVIPTVEPERRVVPLDLFPAALIENIKVLKTYTPDLPGEFSGGLVQMNTIEFPDKTTVRASVNYGFNSRTTFNRFQTYRGGGNDAFGFDDGSRNLPRAIPRDGRLFQGSPYTPAQLQEFGRSFDRNWELNGISSMRPSQSYSLSGGTSFLKGKIGIVSALTFTNSPQRYVDNQRFLTSRSANDFVVFSNYPDFNYDQEATRMGGVFNVAYRFNPANKIIFRTSITRDSEKEGRVFQGLYGSTDSIIQSTRLRWVERGLVSTSVEGEHSVAKLKNSLFHWQLTYSHSKRDEPNYTETVRTQNEDGSFRWASLPTSGFRFFNFLKDKIYEPQGDWSLPFYKGKVTGLFKVGFRGTLRDREFDARRFRFLPNRLSVATLNQPTNQLFAPENIRPDGLVIQETTRTTDAYVADLNVFGGYTMVDLSLGARWRFIGGFRVEDADINVRTVASLIPGAVAIQSSLKNQDVLPGFNVIYALNPRQNLRAAYGRTVSRPDFRELSPFEFLGTLGGFSVIGNPNLRRATIDNYDLRWEWFPGGDQVIAASYFFKKFTDPIETTVQPTTGDLRQSFINAKGATNQGLELELRKGLKFVNPKFSEFAVSTNFTFVTSDVDLSGNDPVLRPLTSRSRPLVGQSRYIVNGIIDWNRPKWRSNARFLANSVSRRITDVGSFGLPDIYQERNVFLDFSYQYDIKENGKWSFKFSAENLGDNNYRWSQSTFQVRNYQLGRTFSIGTSYSFF